VARGIARVGLDAAPKLWDLAGGWLLVQEAGGVVEALEQAPFPLQAGMDYGRLSFPLLFANSLETLQKARLQVQLR
jgi:myo-inositol-1(or 4)-monophosphatase